MNYIKTMRERFRLNTICILPFVNNFVSPPFHKVTQLRGSSENHTTKLPDNLNQVELLISFILTGESN